MGIRSDPGDHEFNFKKSGAIPIEPRREKRLKIKGKLELSILAYLEPNINFSITFISYT